jgi:hybrid cluster-associated redox disulfide protein
MDESMGDFLLKNGLHCVSCSASKNEPLSMACAVHGLDAEDMKEKIQKYVNEVYEA